jgi:hypothetical protein
MQRTPYKAYSSDSDEDSSDSDSSLSTSSSSDDSSDSRDVLEGLQNLGLLAASLSANTILDPTKNTDVEKPYPEFGYYLDTSGGFPTFNNLQIPADPSGNLLESSTASVQNVIMIDSRNRDRQSYPQPTNLTLRLPRTYSQVTGFSILQIKLLSAFYYFRAVKHNTNISIQEFGRTVVSQGNTINQVITKYIREGTYDINGLTTELNIQLNYTPLFYDFPGGFNDFAKKFAVTGDTSLNFNFPGDYYYDSVLDTYIQSPTMALIVSKYFDQQYANLAKYTISNIKIAYYYPVLKEIILDDNYNSSQMNYTLTTSQLEFGETVKSRILNTYQGLFDDVILELINNNITNLDTYRLQHTFRYSLINKYVALYQTQSNRTIFQSPSLNTSLVNLINYKKAQFTTEQLNLYGITVAQYNKFLTENALLFAVINDMMAFYQEYLAIYFGIAYNSFSLDYLANSKLTLPLRDALNAVGISYSLSDTLNNTASVQEVTTDILQKFRVPPNYYWNRMTNLSTPIAYMQPALPADFITTATFNLNTWDFNLDDQDYLNQIVQPNVLDSNNPNTTPVGHLYINRRTQHADIMVPIEPSKYTVLRFKSPARQTIKVETLPRPTKYRYPLYNSQTYDISYQQLFDNSYCFIENSDNFKMDVSSNDFTVNDILKIPGFSTPNTTASFGLSYTSSLALWGSNTNTLSILEPRSFYEFYTPYPPQYITCNAPAYTYPMQLTLAHSSGSNYFSSDLLMFLYQDRGAFMADVSGNRTENPLNYLQVVSSFQSSTTLSINFKAYANKRYYILARSQSVSFATENYRIVPSFPSSMAFTALTNSLVGFNPKADPLSNLTNYNYAQNADPAFIKLPTSSTLYAPFTVDPATSPLSFLEPLMGYDINNVSTDLTNYVGFISNVAQSNAVPNATLRIDPANGYLFQAKNAYDPVSQLYFYSTTTNAILQPYGTAVYTPSTIKYRQASIVHWYGDTFIPPSDNQLLFDSNSIAYSSIRPYSANYPVNSSITGYTYMDRLNITGDLYLGTSNLLNLGEGVMGIGFIPDEGLWDIDSFMFKTIFTSSNSAIDPNLSIKYVGIYPASLTSNQPVGNFELNKALAVLSFQSSITYNSSNLNFGYDLVGGTYYNFQRSSQFQTGSNSYLYGYSQSAYEYNFDVNAYYIAVPFNGLSNPIYYYGLVGSAVPYPKYSQINVASSAPSPEGPHSPPGGQGILLPGSTIVSTNSVYGPPAGYTVSQSQYEQSMPIGTSLLFYANPYPINTITTPYNSWGSFTHTPSELLTDCSGYIMLKDSVYRVFSYETSVNTRSFTERYEFTLDQVFPISSNINFIGTAANESNIAFFGLSNAAASTFLYIRTLNPKTGTIQNTYSEPAPVDFQSTFQLQKALYNNMGGYTFSINNIATGTSAVVSRAFQGASSLVYVTPQTVDPTIKYFDIGQSPKEEYGQFWMFPYKTNGIENITFINPNILTASPPVGAFTAEYTAYTGATPSYANIIDYSLLGSTPSTFTNPIVVRDIAKDHIFMLSADSPTQFFEPTFTVGSVIPTITPSQYYFTSTPSVLNAGANGASWALIGNTLYGNRFDKVDAPKRISQMWQVFYPVNRIVFHQISKNFDSFKDLSGIEYAEYPHTAIAVYDNSENLIRDIGEKWGLESPANFNSGDFAFSGFYFNAYDYAIPVNDNRASDDFYYMTIRGYSPTEKSQVMLRVSAPNKHTFGYITPTDLSGEISTAKYVSVSNDYKYTYYWDKRYQTSILGFDSNFIIDSNGKIFGEGVIQGYAGSNISSVTGFGDYYNRLNTLYAQYSTQTVLTSTIQAGINTSVINFVKSDLQYIIPGYAQNRLRYTDPLRFSILWKSSLEQNYKNLIEEWGLGWNLGFNKVDTEYDTIQKGSSFFKILDDFLNVKINPEMDMNRMDIVAQENLALTQDSTGTTKAFYGKLMLANFGSYAQTLISNPISFSTPLSKLDKFTFQLVQVDGTIVDNSNCEWNAVLQITESVMLTKPSKPFLITPSR